ncbi:tetratricopeptide repeat protein [Desulfatitalea tepidiphila]|uniref:tetratricopeptide repeat protein n=1 Tax=Desulfatitalea tepidiphila TaxID=1185843 RepID=UPI0006B604CA|nr:tetratricopeptide repeat protein [Desulfatitalea tepidiphila]
MPPAGFSLDAVARQVSSLVDRGEFEQALALLSPYRDQPAVYPTLASDFLVITLWSGRPADAVCQFEALPDSFPRRPYLLRNMAKAYFDLGRYGPAASLYAEVVALDPSDEIAIEGWGQALAAQGDLGAVRQALLTLNRSGGDPFRVDLLEARLAFFQELYIEFFEIHDRLISAYPEHADRIAKSRDDWVAGLSQERQTHLLQHLARAADEPDAPARAAEFHALCLVLAGQYQQASDRLNELVATSDLDLAQVPDDRLYWYAWAHFKAGRHRQAEEGFDTILRRNPASDRARIGRLFCLAALAKYDQARGELDRLTTRRVGDPELDYAQAYLFEKQGRFWDAVQVYDRMRENDPTNATIRRLRLRALADMGATSLAAREAVRDLPSDSDMQSGLELDAAADRIRWEEFDRAADDLSASREDPPFAYDHIVALNRAERNREATEAYEGLLAAGDGNVPPAWVRLAAADAYAAEEQPLRALEIYDGILREQPDLKEARLGRFYVLQTLRRWEEADAALKALEADTPARLTIDGVERPHPDHFELALIRAWYLAYQGRLAESEDAFEALHAQAPANMDARNGLAHIYLWRGWPRRALPTFNIIDTLDPSYQPSKTGRVAALERLAEKEAARETAAALVTKRPNNPHTRNTWRSLVVDQMEEWRTEAYGQWEDDDSYDTRIRTEISSPLGLKTRMLGFLLWRGTWYDGSSGEDDTSAYFRRVGVGLDHIVDADWRLRPSVSVNYNDGREPGASLRVDYTPTDRWLFGVFGDSFSTDVARRARAADIEASLVGADVTWRQSEWRQAGIAYTRSFFSDDNERDEIFMGCQQNLWVSGDWRMRIFLDGYATWNSKGDETVYFNPEQAWGGSVTHMTEQTLWDLYRKSFVHRLYVSAGISRQRGFDSDWAGSLRYEQHHAFSDRHVLQAGIAWGRNVYDGEAVYDISLDVEYQWRF